MKWIDSIKNYPPYNEQEEKDKAIILECLSKFEDILTRKNEIAHLTSSAFVINKERDKILMVYHNIYDSWSWTGGHADGERDLLAVAIKEVKEETGVKNVHPLTKDIFSLDILPVIGHFKKGKYVAPHLHLSVTFLVEVAESEDLFVNTSENSAVKWIPMEEVNTYSKEPHMKKVYSKLITKVKEKSSWINS